MHIAFENQFAILDHPIRQCRFDGQIGHPDNRIDFVELVLNQVFGANSEDVDRFQIHVKGLAFLNAKRAYRRSFHDHDAGLNMDTTVLQVDFEVPEPAWTLAVQKGSQVLSKNQGFQLTGSRRG